MPNKNDNFQSIYGLINKKDYRSAIINLVNEKTGRIKKEYKLDINHAWYCVGDCKYRIGDAYGAISAFKKALRAASTDVECLLGIGNCYDALKKPKIAERYFRMALSQNIIEKNKATALINLGNALIDQGRWSEAITYLSIPSRRKDEIGTIAKKNKKFALNKLKSTKQ